jgi:hypothetical protein
MTRRKAVCSTFSALAVIPIAFRSNCFAEDPISWSLADEGLRIGLSTEQSSTNGNLRVVLDNVGSSELSVFVGMNSGNGIGYLVTFTATATDGTQYRIWDFRPEALRPVAGLVVPVVISLAPGATREFMFPLKQLVYMAKGRDITLDSLLQQGYTLNASLEVQQKDLDGASMGGIPPPATGRLWTGRLVCSSRVLKVGH